MVMREKQQGDLMANRIDYFFTIISPFTYLGHQAICAVADKHGAELAFRPVNLGDVFAASGALPLPQRPPARQRYRLLELQRIAELRGLQIRLKPAHFPVDPTQADNTITALVANGQDPRDYMFRLFQATWVRDENVADETVLARYLTDSGFDARAVLDQAESAEVVAIRGANTAAAIDAGALGSPSYVLNGEVFWGQDRIDYIDHALTTGRGPFSA